MARPKPSTRIGEAERTAAQRALQQHPSAGRLQINEYAERSAAAAHAVTAEELAVLFADLPAPRPKLPGSPFGGTRRTLTIAGVVVLALVGLIAVGVNGGGGPAPSPTAAPSPAASAPSAVDPVVPPTISNTPDTPSETVDESAPALLVTIVNAGEQALQFRTTVWDPPFAS